MIAGPDPISLLGVALMEDLEVSCMEAASADPPGPAVARRLERVCREVLTRHGHPEIRAVAQSDRTGTSVKLLLPAPGAKVRELRLSIR